MSVKLNGGSRIRMAAAMSKPMSKQLKAPSMTGLRWRHGIPRLDSACPLMREGKIMQEALSSTVLQRQNRQFEGTGGRSEHNRGLGFRPAFMDTDTLAIYVSCFADGRPAPFHLIDGLPNHLVVARLSSGRVVAVKASVISGFVRDECFYSRDEAARCVSPPVA